MFTCSSHFYDVILKRVIECFRSAETFDVFGYGEQVYQESKFRADVEDKLHFFLEECDNLQVKMHQNKIHC